MTGGFLALALLCPAAPPDPTGLAKGDELTFVGTVEEAGDRPGNRFRRAQTLEIRVLVLEKSAAWADVAVLTLLRRTDDAVAGAVGAITGGPAEKAAPPAAAGGSVLRWRCWFRSASLAASISSVSPVSVQRRK